MSRIGRLPVAIPAGVTVEVAENNVVTVKGPKGTLTRELPTEMEIKVEGEEVTVTRPSDLKKMKSLHGLTRTLINNMVVGVTEGYQKVLEVNGVGYRAAKSGNKLTLNLGYSHPVEMIDPEGVETVLEGQNKITVKGPKGTLTKELPVEMEIKVEGDEVIVTRPSDLKKMKSLHGLTRTLINNMVVGVTDGYEKVLEVNGVGYRAAKSGNKLTLNLGYSHPVEMIDPEGIETVLEGQNKITVKGIDKEKVGQFAAEIRDKRRPEPYKGKGIKYADEVIRRKVGKTGKK